MFTFTSARAPACRNGDSVRERAHKIRAERRTAVFSFKKEVSPAENSAAAPAVQARRPGEEARAARDFVGGIIFFGFASPKTCK
jgi:hypothetical protein